jgi:hypothetical protein
MRIFVPLKDSNSMTHSSSFPMLGPTSSTNAACAGFPDRLNDPETLLSSAV